jgi:hypothetical protein
LLDHKGDENPDDEFLILDDLNGLEGAIFRFKKNLLSSLSKPLHVEFPFKQCNDILTVLGFERTIYDQNVTAGNSRILHGHLGHEQRRSQQDWPPDACADQPSAPCGHPPERGCQPAPMLRREESSAWSGLQRG